MSRMAIGLVAVALLSAGCSTTRTPTYEERARAVFERAGVPATAAQVSEMAERLKTLDELKRPSPAETQKPPRKFMPDLHDAVWSNDTQAVKKLLSENADPGMNANSQGWKLLHVAVNRGNAEMAQLLISAGASVDEPDWHDGITPLHLAVLMKPVSTNMVVLLLNNTKRIDEPTDENYWLSPGVSKYSAGAQFFGNNRIQKNPAFASKIRQLATALHLAARRGDRGVIELILKHGASKTVKDAEGLTPAEVAESAGHSDIAVLLKGE